MDNLEQIVVIEIPESLYEEIGELAKQNQKTIEEMAMRLLFDAVSIFLHQQQALKGEESAN